MKVYKNCTPSEFQFLVKKKKSFQNSQLGMYKIYSAWILGLSFEIYTVVGKMAAKVEVS